MTEFTLSLCDESTMFMERAAKVSFNIASGTKEEFEAAATKALDLPTGSSLCFFRSVTTPGSTTTTTEEEVDMADPAAVEALCKEDPLRALRVAISAGNVKKPLRKTASVCVYREGDFMAAPTECEVEYDPVDHHGAQAMLQAAILKTVEGLGGDDVNLSYAVMVDFEKTAISNDRQLHEIFRGQQEGEENGSNKKNLEVYFSVVTRAAAKEVELEVLKSHHVSPSFKCGFSILDVVGLKEKVLEKAHDALLLLEDDDSDDEGNHDGWHEDAHVDVTQQTLFVLVDGSKQQVSSDRLLAEIFEAHLNTDDTTTPESSAQKNTRLRIIVEEQEGGRGGTSGSAKGTQQKVSVTAEYVSNSATSTAEFSIVFQPNQPNQLESLKQEIRGELDLPLDSKILLNARVAAIEGDVTLSGDKQLSEMLTTSSSETNAKEDIAVTITVTLEESKSTIFAVDVACREETEGAEEGTFTFKYRFDQENALKSLRCDVEEVLDLDSPDFDLLYLPTDGEGANEKVVVTSDRLLREIIQEHVSSKTKINLRTQAVVSSPLSPGSVYDAGSTLTSLNTTANASLGGGKSPGRSMNGSILQVFNLSLEDEGGEGEGGKFAFSWIKDVTGVAELQQEIRGELDIFDMCELRIEAAFGDKDVPNVVIETDQQLEEIIAKGEPSVRIKVAVGKSPTSRSQNPLPKSAEADESKKETLTDEKKRDSTSGNPVKTPAPPSCSSKDSSPKKAKDSSPPAGATGGAKKSPMAPSAPKQSVAKGGSSSASSSTREDENREKPGAPPPKAGGATKKAPSAPAQPKKTAPAAEAAKKAPAPPAVAKKKAQPKPEAKKAPAPKK